MTTIAVTTMVTNYMFVRGSFLSTYVSHGGDPRERSTFGHVSAHGSLVTFTHV